MGNCYGLLPLQTCQKRSAPCKRPEVRFRALSGMRMECQADGLQRAPVEPSSGHRGMNRSGRGRLNPRGDLGNGFLLDANEAGPILVSTLITDGVGAAMDYRQLFDRRPRQPSQNGGRIAGLAVFAAVPGMVVDQHRDLYGLQVQCGHCTRCAPAHHAGGQPPPRNRRVVDMNGHGCRRHCHAPSGAHSR